MSLLAQLLLTFGTLSLLAIGGASLLANGALKPLVPRRRPAAELLPEFRSLDDPPTSSSFPSGHAASAAAFAMAVAMESPKSAVWVAIQLKKPFLWAERIPFRFAEIILGIK